MSRARGSVSGSITRYKVCIKPKKPVPLRSVAGSVPEGQTYRAMQPHHCSHKQTAQQTGGQTPEKTESTIEMPEK